MPNLMAVFSPHTVGLEGLCLHYGVDGTTMCRGADLSDTRKNDIECDAIQGMSVLFASTANIARWSLARNAVAWELLANEDCLVSRLQ